MNMKSRHRVGSLLLAGMMSTLLGGCDQETRPESDAAAAAMPATISATTAATILTNGRIYTLDPAMPWAEAVAIRDGKYLYVGDAAGVEGFVGDQTLQVDLQGKMLMPGVNDAHAHPWQGGVKTLYSCNFPFTATPDEIAARLRACIAANPDVEWVVGGQWTSDFFRKNDIPSPAPSSMRFPQSM